MRPVLPIELRDRTQPGGSYRLQNVIGAASGARIWYVGSTVTAGGNSLSKGQSPTAPMATLTWALASNTNLKAGHTIILLPGHAEDVASAALVNLSTAGVHVLGTGEGNLIPTLTLVTADTATIQITAANCILENVKIISDLADMAVGLDLKATADGAIVRNCWFTDGAAAKELVIAITVEAACDNILIEGNRIHTVLAGGCAEGIALEGATTDSIIRDNVILGDFSGAAIEGATAAAVNLVVAGNRINQADAAAALGINLHASTTGAVYDNYVLNAKPNDPGIIAAACMVTQNYCSNVAGLQGFYIPAQDA